MNTLAGGTLASSVLSITSCQKKITRPNILLIHGDQHRFDCLGAYGNEDILTPNIDAIAEDGERFANSFCPYPVCTPSRYSLLSGMYVHQHRGWSNHCTLSPEIETFPAILKNNGYRTKAVGKMHFTPTYLDVGFEEMILAEQDGPGRWDDDYHRELMAEGLVDRNDLEDQRREYRKNAGIEYWDNFGALPSNLPEEYHSTNWIGRQALNTLEGWNRSGNLLMVGFIKPHHPFDPPHNWIDSYDPDQLSILPGWVANCFAHDLEMSKGYFPHTNLTKKKLRRIMAYYYATISQIDYQIGQMVALLKNKKMYENTMIIYTSDHGEFLGFHHLLLKGNYLYDPLAKVPLIIKYPGYSKRGTVNQSLVNNIDLAPTILKRAACQSGPKMMGFDLLAGEKKREFVFAHSGKGTNKMARSEKRKLLLSSKRQSLYFDLSKDPLEMENLFGRFEYQKEIEECSKAITEWEGTDLNTDTYLDENAPQINQPNVPAADRNHRGKIIEYFQNKMKNSMEPI